MCFVYPDLLFGGKGLYKNIYLKKGGWGGACVLCIQISFCLCDKELCKTQGFHYVLPFGMPVVGGGLLKTKCSIKLYIFYGK